MVFFKLCIPLLYNWKTKLDLIIFITSLGFKLVRECCWNINGSPRKFVPIVLTKQTKSAFHCFINWGHWWLQLEPFKNKNINMIRCYFVHQKQLMESFCHPLPSPQHFIFLTVHPLCPTALSILSSPQPSLQETLHAVLEPLFIHLLPPLFTLFHSCSL